MEETSLQAEKDVGAETWERYLATKDQTLRNDIVLHYSGLVKYIATRMRGVYKNYAQMDDVINQGIIALIDAVEKYDPSRGVKFETFASIKIKGSVIDYIRSQDWIPRRLRKMVGDLDQAHHHLCSELGREPTNSELSAAMKMTQEQLDRAMEQTYHFHVLSYEEVIWQNMSGVGEEPTTDNVDESPEASLMEEELRKQLVATIDRLNERERTVISLYYYDNLKLKEIAQVLGVSESRVCQIHSASIIKMKNSMQTYMKE